MLNNFFCEINRGKVYLVNNLQAKPLIFNWGSNDPMSQLRTQPDMVFELSQDGLHVDARIWLDWHFKIFGKKKVRLSPAHCSLNKLFSCWFHRKNHKTKNVPRHRYCLSIFNFGLIGQQLNNFSTWENLKNTVFGLVTHDFGGVTEVKKID